MAAHTAALMRAAIMTKAGTPAPGMSKKAAFKLLADGKRIRRPVWPAGRHVASPREFGYAFYDADGSIVWRSLTSSDHKAKDWVEYLP